MQLIQELLSLSKFPFETVSESEFQPLDMALFEAEESKSVVFMKCPLFDKTLKKHPEVNKALAKFLKQKQSDPMQPFGSKDRGFVLPALKKFIHAGLTQDVSLIYTREGKSPTTIKLYAIMSHEELGIGTPSKPSKMNAAVASMNNQEMSPMS